MGNRRGLAGQLQRMRREAGLTQMELAERVGTSKSVISRLENAEYGAHSLTMLRRVAEALGKDVEINFVAHQRAAKVG